MNEIFETVEEITAKTTKELENMVRRAETLKSLDELNLSARTKTYLKNRFNSLDEIVFEGRLMAHELANHPERVDARKKSILELANALDVAGFIRHDINEHSFAICWLYAAIFGTREIPSSLKDFRNIFGGKDGIQYDESRIGNERYESFKNPVEELEDVKHSLEISLTGKEAEVIICRFGIADGKAHTLEEVATRFNVTRERIRAIEAKALRKLRCPRVKLPSIMMSLYEGGERVEEIIEELENIRKDPIFQKEAELRQMLRNISNMPFAFAEEATTYLDGGGSDYTEIEKLDLSVRSYNCLKRADINTVADIIRYPREDWPKKVRNLGSHGIREVEEKIREYGYPDFRILS